MFGAWAGASKTLLALAALGLVAAGSVGAASAQRSPRPNIVLLMGDDHGWEETGYNGHPFVKTPTLDEMAASGLRLDHFYAHPSCSPTRGSVLTGRHPNRYGTFHPGCSIRPEEITIAQLLRKAGYATAHFGKWHVGPVKAGSPTNPGAMGFDEWLSHDNFFEMNPQLSRNGGPPQRYEGEGSEVIVNEAVRFIAKAVKRGKPFFVVVWFGSPHEPYSGLERDLALYDNLPQEYAARMVRLTSNKTGRQVRRPLREVLRERYAEITAMDRAIGKLRSRLKTQGLQRNTLLWYCGDNGIPSSGLAESRFRGLKGKVYEGGVRVPGLIEWPAGIPKPRATQVNAVTSDMLPTLCALAGVKPPDRPLDGVNLAPLFDGRMTSRPRPICFWSFRGAPRRGQPREPYIDPELQKGTTPLVKLLGGLRTRNFVNYRYKEIREGDFTGPRAILDNRYKLVIDGERNSGVELFDLQSDPGESKNLVHSQPELAGQLQTRLRAWQESVLHSLLGEDYR
ncbi:MAG: sulfatase-like hydrolase/transferase [Verrucomicrobia bacterium]|nr:sulfatase-like hydrolase/transferase [Verrucomicrobiota bacterium]